MKGYEDLLKLLKKVQATGGLDCDEKSITDYQDMIGHSSEEQLEELANGCYKEAFYRVYGNSYGIVEAIRFYCKHGKKIVAMIEQIDRLTLDLEEANEKTVKEQEKAYKMHEGYMKALDDIKEAQQETSAAREEIEKQAQEIMRLKAMLFDLTTGREKE